MKNSNNINFLVGLISIASVDKTVIKEFEPLKDLYLEKSNHESQELFKSIFIKSFEINEANKNFSEQQKDLFFNLGIMLAFLDEFSEQEESLIRSYADDLNYSQEKITKIINDLNYETSKNLDFNLLFWLSKMIKGYIHYIKTGVTMFETYYSFRHLHFLTNNRINLLMVFLAEVFNSIEEVENKNVLGSNIKEVSESIKQNGYFVFKERISDEIIDNLYNFTSETNSYPIFSNKRFSDCFEGEGVLFNDKECLSTRYEYHLNKLLDNKHIFKIIEQYNFTNLSREFFNSKSLLTNVHMWWTTPIKDDMDRYTGQVFHIDIDRSQVLLLLIYLNDVDEDNGPHIYVKNSHINKPHHLLEDRRMNEEELVKYYSKENIIKIPGKKGTVIATNPLGFHRGQPLNKESRLALKFEYSPEGFGEMLPLMKVKNEEVKNIVQRLENNYDYTFSKFI